MFEALRIKFNDPLFQGLLVRIFVAILLIAGMIGLVYYVQYRNIRWPHEEADRIEETFETESEMVEAAVSNGDAKKLFELARDKRDNWKRSFTERLTACQLRMKVADRLLELPVEPFMTRMAQTAMLRGVITEQSVYRHYASIPEDRVDTLALTAMEFRNAERSEVKNLVIAADSLVAMGKVLDSPSEEVSDELIANVATKMGAAAKANREDMDIATTHYFWIDWARSKLGDTKCVPIVNAVNEHYSKSGRENIRSNMRRLRLSMNPTPSPADSGDQ